MVWLFEQRLPQRKEIMSNALPVIQGKVLAEYTQDQLKLITDTVAKKATPQELQLFLYRCKNLGLDPLKPGLIHFVKYDSSSTGAIVVGIDGFRSLAARTGKLKGINRGVIRDSSGKCIGAWAEVHRSDWELPAREEVSLSEYNTGRAMWAKMPETMIKKVAEAAALRMAFPDELGGVYATEEMDQADKGKAKPKDEDPVLEFDQTPSVEAELVDETFEDEPGDVGSYVVQTTIGRPVFKGKKIADVDKTNLRTTLNYYSNKQVSGVLAKDLEAIRTYLGGI
jgi:phage recombination protein Bet